jgi:penicillin-binding protein 2
MALVEQVGGRDAEPLRLRLYLVMWGVGAAIVLLIFRLYALQIRRGEELVSKGRRNFVQQLTVPHDRGIIYDRHGRILVDNRPSLDLQIIPAFLGRPAAAQLTLTHLGRLLNLAAEDTARLTATLAQRRGLDRFVPIIVRRDLTPEEVEGVEQERSLLRIDGVDIVEGRRRTYHYGSLAAHVLGYVSEIDAPSLEQERGRGNPLAYDLGNMVGREGIERSYEVQLRGVDGRQKVIVDAKGRRQKLPELDALMGGTAHVQPVPGHNVYLTLDLELQVRAEAAFKEHGIAGSVVALDPRSGALLSLVSLPAYDVNFVSGISSRQTKGGLDADPLKPWINRSIAGQYAPGSTFKPVTALAALGARVAAPHERIGCPGYYKLGRHVWRCWKEHGHGALGMHEAMKRSCDTFFYTIGGRTGLDPIAKMARQLGLGSRTGIALRGEQPGNAPTEAFHNRVDASTGGYQRGMSINTAIGQGSTLVTPLQLAITYSALAHGTQAFVPQLVDRIESADFRTTESLLAGDQVLTRVHGEPPVPIYALDPQVLTQLEVPPAHMDVVRQSLQAVSSEPGGTGYGRRSRRVSMAGKTGTAQVVRLGRERLRDWQTDYVERDHAWFAGYAPAKDPEIVVVVLNEHGGHGGPAAMPVAVAVIDAYFDLKAGRQPSASGAPK